MSTNVNRVPSPRRSGEKVPKADEGSLSGKARSLAALVLPLLMAITVLASPSIARACPVCYGDPNSPLTKGANNGIWFLLSIVGVVQIGFIALFWTFWKRAREFRKHRDSFQLIEGGMR